jgi:hypothetical protein
MYVFSTNSEYTIFITNQFSIRIWKKERRWEVYNIDRTKWSYTKTSYEKVWISYSLDCSEQASKAIT